MPFRMCIWQARYRWLRRRAPIKSQAGLPVVMKHVKLASIPLFVILLLSLYPQIIFWINGGSSLSYFVSNYDEPGYSAYVNALVEGRPRKFDPFLQTETSHESIYSIQFLPAYAVAIPTRWIGLSTSTALVILAAVIAVLSYLALYWLLTELTGSAALASAASLGVLCLGTAAAFQGELRHLLTGNVLVDFFPFLRRYQPGLAFPIVFVFCSLCAISVRSRESKKVVLYAVAAGLAFSMLVFSYFYLWTAAAAFLGSFVLISLVLDRQGRSKAILLFGIVFGIGASALIPYFQLLGARSADLDSVQLLDRTHAPTIVSPTVLLGLLVIAIFSFFVYRGRLKTNDPRALFCLSFSITPLVLLNQQVVTGVSLQPVHYEIFIANYFVLAAAAILLSLFIRPENAAGPEYRMKGGFVYFMLAAGIWGFFEASASSGRAMVAATIRDRSIPAIREIARRSPPDGSVVLATNFVTADIIPTIAPFRPLWNAHLSNAGGINLAEYKRLFYQYLYFSGFAGNDLADALRANSFEVTMAVFGSERALPTLGTGAKPITTSEIQSEVQKYNDFTASFDRTLAASPMVSYLIVPVKAEPDLSNVDRWYTRDAGVEVGLFKVYQLSLK